MMEINTFFIVTASLCILTTAAGYGIRYGHVLFLVPGLNVKLVPRKIATAKYFGNRFLIVGALGVPFSILHLLVQGELDIAIMGLYLVITTGFLLYVITTVNRLNDYNAKIMTKYRKAKREQERAKVKPRPVKRQTSGVRYEAPNLDHISSAPMPAPPSADDTNTSSTGSSDNTASAEKQDTNEKS